jgi:hypothetical protein
MKLLVVIHRDNAALEAFFQDVRRENLAGFTVLRSSGVGRTSERVPLEFSGGGLLSLLTGSGEAGRLENTTALSFVDDTRLERVLAILRTHLTDLNKPGSGLYAVLNVETSGGLE